MMDDGLGFHAVVMVFLNDRSPVDRLPLLDDGSTVAITVSIVIAMAVADGHADTDRSDANTDLFGHRRDGKRTDCRGAGLQGIVDASLRRMNAPTWTQTMMSVLVNGTYLPDLVRVDCQWPPL